MWFLLVPLALYSVFFLLPSILGIGYSFTDWNSRSMGEVNFVGLENFDGNDLFIQYCTSKRNLGKCGFVHCPISTGKYEADSGPVSGNYAERGHPGEGAVQDSSVPAVHSALCDHRYFVYVDSELQQRHAQQRAGISASGFPETEMAF